MTITRIHRREQRAFTLIELLITIAIIGIVSAIALPMYNSYIETANMTKVNTAFQTAIRYTREAMVKDNTRISMGLPSDLPQTPQGWINLYDPDGSGTAPGGGPIYMPYGKVSTTNTTGTVVVDAPNYRGWVDLWRPAYKDLTAEYVRVYHDGRLVIKKQ